MTVLADKWSNWLRRDLTRTLTRFRHVPLWTIPALYARAAMLHWFLPHRVRLPTRPERVVVTLSTIPSRIAHLRPVLNSLLDQSEPADRIVLALPDFSLRENVAYPRIGELRLPLGVDVLATQDLGPATKLLPTLAAERHALIVVVDDDVVYPRDFLANLLAAHRLNPTAAVGLRGVVLVDNAAFVDLEHRFGTAMLQASPVDILFGTWGYLLPAGALDSAVQGLEQTAAPFRWVDDVWISGHLARRGVQRLVVPATAIPIETANAARRSLAGGPNKSGSNDHSAIEAFADDW